MNILYYESSTGFGGSANALAQIVNNLDRNQFCPFVIIKNYGSQIDKIKDAEIIKLKEHLYPKNKSYLLYLLYFVKNLLPEALKIFSIIKKKEISLVHVNISIMAGIPAIIAAKFAGVPCVSHFRLTRKFFKIELFFIKWINKLIVLNTSSYESVKKIVGKERVGLIYDGIEVNDFEKIESGLFRKELGLNSMPLVGLVGRIVQGKGQKEFVLAAREILKSISEVKFIIVGDAIGDKDAYYKEVKDLVRNSDLQERVIFAGWRNDIKNILTDLDIFVFATTTFPEGFGITIIEAMILGKPVIATNIPGPSDIVIHGETGYLVPPEDTDVMTEKIAYLLKNREVAKKMGELGKKRVEEYFNIKNTVDKIGSLYIELLKK